MFEQNLIITVILFVLLGLLWRKSSWRRKVLPSLDEWFMVMFDEVTVTMSASPPGSESWEQTFLWSEITRICFKSEGISASDGVYVFTTRRPESFVIPIEARGGTEFWSKVIDRELFPVDSRVRQLRA